MCELALKGRQQLNAVRRRIGLPEVPMPRRPNGRLAGGQEPDSGVIEGADARQNLAFEKLQAGASAG